MKTFIKQEREKRDIMQKDLALEMCIAPATLATYENTDRDPPLEILCKMADKFDGIKKRSRSMSLPSNESVTS